MKLDNRQRVVNFRDRQKIKATTKSPVTGSYKCAQILAKAVKPYGHMEKANSHGEPEESIDDDDDVHLIQKMYNHDDISVQSAGRKSRLLAGADKIPMAKRFMIDSHSE